ncbi:MAG: hypothetical protein ACYTHM_24850 [Planctomycetota bacterium]|jgi:hypothetical protein
MRHFFLLPILFALLGVAVWGGARVEAECKTCKGGGEVACRAHLPPTAFTLKHSNWVLYECCLGKGKRPCPKCKPADKETAFEAWKRELVAWVLERRKNVDVVLFEGEPGVSSLVGSATLRHGECENFRLVSTARPFPVRRCDVPEGLFPGLPSKDTRKRNFSPEHYDWILLKRCEDAFRDYKTVFQNDGQFRSAATNYHKDIFIAAEGKYDVFLWDRVPPHLVCGRKFFGSADEQGVYKHGTRVTTVVGGQANTRNDEMLHRYLTHMVHHLFIEAYEIVIGFEMPSWVPEGFAHYMEWKKFGDFKICCNFERRESISIPSKPKDVVLRMVTSGKAMPAASLINLKYNTMDARAHCQIWSLFHFLIEGAPRKSFIQFIKRLKHTRDQMKSFKEGFGYSLLLVDEPWREFVLKNYR